MTLFSLNSRIKRNKFQSDFSTKEKKVSHNQKKRSVGTRPGVMNPIGRHQEGDPVVGSRNHGIGQKKLHEGCKDERGGVEGKNIPP